MANPSGKPSNAPERRAGRVLKTLDRVLSKAGLGSCMDARKWIGAGKVRVNGKLIQTPDHWVEIGRDKITVDGKPLEPVRQRYVLLYKPRGYITTYRDPQGRATVYDLLSGVPEFVGQVGRLDLESSGLLLLTNDNQLAEKALTNPEYHIPRRIWLRRRDYSPMTFCAIARGCRSQRWQTRPAKVVRIRGDSPKYAALEITITEGRNRQVRRMLEAVGSPRGQARRTQIGDLTLSNLSIGKWRDLTPVS